MSLYYKAVKRLFDGGEPVCFNQSRIASAYGICCFCKHVLNELKYSGRDDERKQSNNSKCSTGYY